MLQGWNTMVNREGREGANRVLAQAFGLPGTSEGVMTGEGHERDSNLAEGA